ncbi:MAG: hypothetical protein FJ009_12675 [Chloroflexi bacterium]|nr:hypothetical protein [Chloroflexota bacterium]
MEVIDPTRIPRWESKTPCLPTPDLFEELVLLARLKVEVKFRPLQTEIGSYRAEVSIKLHPGEIPWARTFFLSERDALAAWLRQMRLRVEMLDDFREKGNPSG